MEMWQAYATYGYPVIQNTNDGLVNRDPANNQLVGELATKWDAIDANSWRFYLRPNVKLHDVSPFNVEAAAFSINDTWSKENNFRIRTFIGPESQGKPVDELTIDVV